MTSFLQSQPIDVEALAASVAGAARGAIVTFAGTVRDHHAGREVIGLEYAAYDAMAELVAERLRLEAADRWPVTIAMVHRVGALSIGEVAVAIAVAAAHREVAFDACRWLIDALKQRVPIWKRERYADGAVAWVDPTAPGGAVAVPG